ncbi:hypothetical protein BFJ71_g14326 [Fusarium oxysporum]|nr:hypothetical protein BFJ71_g14326 [Fusarium oxysporum]
MASSKLIVILGATGNQGGSVANTFLQEPGWQVRALTRNTSSPKAQALAARGAQVAHADLDEPESFAAAFEGANAIFAAAEYETQQLKNIIDAIAKVPTLERFVLSALTNVAKWSNRKYTHVYHFDSKAHAAEYVQEKYPELWEKTSIFQPGFFLSNYTSNPLTKVSKFIGHLEPDVKLPFIAPEEDSSPIVKALVNEPAGKNIIAYRGWLTMPELAQTVTKATGLKAESITLPKGMFPPELPEELKLELGDNFAACNEIGYEARNDPTVIHPRDLKSPPTLDTVEDY